MATEISVPSLGESVTGGILAAWLKEDGDLVTEGEEVFELETDKATLSVPSPAGGVLSRMASEGDEVQVGEVVATVDAASSPSAGAPVRSEPARGEAEPERPDERLSPAVRRIVREEGLDPSRITGTGKDGRITKGDALAFAESSKREPAREAAREAAPAAAPAQTRVEMSNLRKRIAENLVRSRQSSAHLTTFNEIDMSAVMELRSSYRDAFAEKHGVKLGFMSFFVKACVAALREYPEANAFVDGDYIVYNGRFNIGVAVSTDRGLIVPVIKDAGAKSLADIETEILSFASRAKEKKLGVDDLTGGTFSITNGGVFGSLLSTPIPTPPQSAILGIHAIQKRPVVVDDQITIRSMTYAALTYDHRVMDGREAVGFLVKVKRIIEDPRVLLLDL